MLMTMLKDVSNDNDDDALDGDDNALDDDDDDAPAPRPSTRRETPWTPSS